MPELRYFLETDGTSPFEDWFQGLEALAAAKVVTAMARLEQGNFSTVKPVGEGVLECRIDWGPGYRVYFARHGEQIVILLAGGTKRRQQKDIAAAKSRWIGFRRRKRPP